MNDQQHHPITPPPELRRLWAQQAQRISPYDPVEWMQYVSEKAAQWGADTELEACCEWFQEFYKLEFWMPGDLKHLRATRRPKPPSLKRVALLQLDTLNADLGLEDKGIDLSQIREALEALPND